MKKTATLLITCAAALILAGCSQSGTNPVSAPYQANVASSVLQMNVGTANLFGDTPAAAKGGLNLAVTYRQPAGALNPGASATLVNTPTLTLPHALAGLAGTADAFLSTVQGGPAAGEVGTTSMTATSQAPNVTTVTSFGTSGGAFGLGLEPFNYGSVAGVPDNVAPYAVPLLDAIVAGGAPDPNAFIPGGGPPAFNIAGNVAAVQKGFNAISEGLDVFETAATVGSYSLSVSVPANTGTVIQTATASITSAALLPAFFAPVPVVTAAGGATLAVALPAGVTEAYIQITDFGPTTALATSCVGASAATPVYYTIEVTASGTATLPAGSLCTTAQNTTATGSASDGDAFTVQGVGFDYPAYEASYPNSLGKPAPSLAGAGASHQADVTISSQGVYNLPVGGGPAINGAGGAVLPAGVARSHGSSAIRK